MSSYGTYSAPQKMGEFSANEVFGGPFSARNSTSNPFGQNTTVSVETNLAYAPPVPTFSPSSSSSSPFQSPPLPQPTPPSNSSYYSFPNSSANPFMVEDPNPQATDSFYGLPLDSQQPNGVQPPAGTPENEQFIGVKEKEEEQDSSHFWQLKFYQTLFNVEATQVLYRIFLTFAPWKFNFFASIKQNPDFYGPFWISTTLAFVIAVSSNLHSFFISHSTHWEYDVKKIIAAFAVTYSYTIAIPIILWLVLKYIDAKLKLSELTCLYGYALVLFIPASIVSTFVAQIYRSVAIVFCASLSGFFIVSNLMVPLKANHLKRGLVIIIVLAALHLGLTLTFLFYFFAGGKII